MSIVAFCATEHTMRPTVKKVRAIRTVALRLNAEREANIGWKIVDANKNALPVQYVTVISVPKSLAMVYPSQ